METIRILRVAVNLVIVWASIPYSNTEAREQVKAKGYKWCAPGKKWYKVVKGMATDTEIEKYVSEAFTAYLGRPTKAVVVPVWDYNLNLDTDRGYSLKSPSMIACWTYTKEQGIRCAQLYTQRVMDAIGLNLKPSDTFLEEQYAKYSAIRDAQKAESHVHP